MKCGLTLAGVFAIVCSIIVQAQTSQTPKPGPEEKKLGVFLGPWSVDGEIKPGNLYGIPAGKVNTVERYQWMPGEFFLQMNREGKISGSEIKHMIIFGYDSVAKKYTGTWYGLTVGGTNSAALTNTGNTWQWSGTGHTPDGKTYQERCATTVAPNASYTTKCETSPDGKTWSPSYEGKATKMK